MKKDFSSHQATAEVILNELFRFMPEDPERFSQEVQQQLVLTAIGKCISIIQIITGCSGRAASEVVHTTYEKLNPNFNNEGGKADV